MWSNDTPNIFDYGTYNENAVLPAARDPAASFTCPVSPTPDSGLSSRKFSPYGSADNLSTETNVLPSLKIYQEKNQFVNDTYPRTITSQVAQQTIILIKQIVSWAQGQNTDYSTPLPASLEVLKDTYPTLGILYAVCLSRISKLVYQEDDNLDQENTTFLFEQIGSAIEKNDLAPEVKANFTLFLKLYKLLNKDLKKLKQKSCDALAAKFLKLRNKQYKSYVADAPTRPTRPVATISATPMTQEASNNFYVRLSLYNKNIKKNQIAYEQYRNTMNIYQQRSEDCYDHIVNNRYRFYQRNIHPLLQRVADCTSKLKIRYSQRNKLLTVHPEFFNSVFLKNLANLEVTNQGSITALNEEIITLKIDRDNLQKKTSTFNFINKYRLNELEKTLSAKEKELENLKNILPELKRKYFLYLWIDGDIKNFESQLKLYEDEKIGLIKTMQNIPHDFVSKEECVTLLSQLLFYNALRDEALENLEKTSRLLDKLNASKLSLDQTAKTIMSVDECLELNERYQEEIKIYEQQLAAFNAYNQKAQNSNFAVSIEEKQEFYTGLSNMLIRTTQKSLLGIYKTLKSLNLQAVQEIDETPITQIEGFLQKANILKQNTRDCREATIYDGDD